MRKRKSFYHGILAWHFEKSCRTGQFVLTESPGMDIADILIKPKNPDTGIVIELKYARTFNELDQACARALEQLKDRRYDEALRAGWA